MYFTSTEGSIKARLNSSSKLNFRNDGWQPCELCEVQPVCCVLCYQGERYAQDMEDQRLFLLLQKVGFTSQEGFAVLSPPVLRSMCSSFPTALESVSLTSWQWPAAGFLRVLCEGRKHRGGASETEGSFPRGMASTPPHQALCQGHWGSRVTKPGPQTHSISLPLPCYPSTRPLGPVLLPWNEVWSQD